MKIEYVEITLKTVLEYFQKDFKTKAGEKIKHFGEPLVDPAKGWVVFKLFVENNEGWNRRYHHVKTHKDKK